MCKKWDVQLEEFGREEDHVHLLLDTHPNLTLSKFINNLKMLQVGLSERNLKST